VKKISFGIRKVSLIMVPHGQDEIQLTIDKPSTFPEQNFDAVVKIEVAQCYGRIWLKDVFGIELTAEHDKLGGNPDMFVYERNLEEERKQKKARKRK
jgi:hypothetical protein